ncbi:MAG: hypothetical protein ACO1QB_13315 [Verrucomicrobiales bacterium]
MIGIAGFCSLGSENPALSYLVIGGYAVAAHGPEDAFDLMLVHASTFEKFGTSSEARVFNGIPARVPGLDHLLALKLHALKQGSARRSFKDAEDVEMLIRRNKIDLTQEHYRNLFLKHGTSEIYETILRILKS